MKLHPEPNGSLRGWAGAGVAVLVDAELSALDWGRSSEVSSPWISPYNSSRLGGGQSRWLLHLLEGSRKVKSCDRKPSRVLHLVPKYARYAFKGQTQSSWGTKTLST